MTAELPSRRMSGEVTTAPGRGSTVRTVIDYSDAWPCYVPVGRDSCQLKRGHVGGHLGYPDPWPIEDISAGNPRSERAVTAAMERHPSGKARP